MSQVYVIVWESDQLQLRRVPSEGSFWKSYSPPIAVAPLPRPTRMERIKEFRREGLLTKAIQQLFENFDIDLPVWFLLPEGWGSKFWLDDLPGETPEETMEHIKWELRLRLLPQNNAYRFLLGRVEQKGPLVALVVRNEILEFIEEALKLAEVEFHGITLTPIEGEGYSFEHPWDLRDSIPLTQEEEIEPSLTLTPSISPMKIGIAAAVAVLSIGVLLYYYLSSSVKEPQVPVSPHQTVIEESKVPPSATVERERAPTPATPSVPKEPLPDSLPPPPKVTQASLPLSAPSLSLSSLLRHIDKQGEFLLGVLSAGEIKLLVSQGEKPLSLAPFSDQKEWALLKPVTHWEEKGKKISLWVASGISWKGGEGINAPNWEALIKSYHLTLDPSSRSVLGSKEAILPLLDTLWNNPKSVGITKVVFGTEAGKMRLTVQ